MSAVRAFVLGTVLVLGGLGCSSGGAAAQSGGSGEASPPDWFLNPDRAYSEDTYLTAVASGASSQEAQNKAFGNLARVFEADIQASKDLKDDYREVTKGGQVASTRQETVLITRSTVQSNQKLLNSEVLERGKAGDTYYALVGMKRQETMSIYSQEIESNRRKIEDYRGAAEETDNPITRLAFLQQALVIARVNDRLVTQRNIVAGGAAPDQSSSVTELRQAVRKAQEACPVVVRASTEEEVPPSIVDQVGATLETAGFRVIKRPEEAILEALVKYRERPALESREEEFLRWTLAIELTDQTTRQTLETFTTEQRAGAMSKAAVQRRAHSNARRAIENEFATFLNKTLLAIDQ
jgi:hypothetical protein